MTLARASRLPCIQNVSGKQQDSDPACEYYTEVKFTVADVEKDDMAWYIGYALAWYLGAEKKSELPEIFRDPDKAGESWFE